MARYLITGGAGFIGSHVAEALVRENEKVRILDNFSTGRRENLEPLRGKAEVVEGSITDYDVCRRACEGIECVFHHAALPSVPRSVKDPMESNEVNVAGTLTVLCAARDSGVRRVVYAGSSSAYGDNPVSPKHEGLLPGPKSPYAVGKLTSEYYCHVFSEVYGLDTVTLRYFNVFGPRQDPQSQYAAVIPRFITAALEGRRPVIYGDGTQSRDFTYVANNVEANLLAARCPEPLGGAVINIACGETFSLLELLEIIRECTGLKVDPIFEPPRAGDVLHSRADISLAARRLNYAPKVTFREGLRRTVEFYSNLLKK